MINETKDKKARLVRIGVKEMEKDVLGKLVGYFIVLMIILAGALIGLNTILQKAENENVGFDYQQEVVIAEEIEHI